MRARDIKPGFYKNEALAECSPWARLLFPGLWMLADREGRLEYRPKRIKAELFPYDSIDAGELVDELETHGLVIRYVVDECEYLWIPTFLNHQRPHSNEVASKLPPYTEGVASKKENASDLGSKDFQPRSEALRPSSLTPSSLPPEERESSLRSDSLSPAADATDSPPPPEEVSPSPETPKGKTPDCPHQRIITLYHECLPELPRVRTWDHGREKHLAARWRETLARMKASGKPHDTEAGLLWWRDFFLKRVRPSPLLMGQIQRKNGGAWSASLPWLVKPENYAKTLEGQYLERRPNA